jgi:hypothetical protein
MGKGKRVEPLTEKEMFILWYTDKEYYFSLYSSEGKKLSNLNRSFRNYYDINEGDEFGPLTFDKTFDGEGLWERFLNFLLNESDADIETYLKYKDQ